MLQALVLVGGIANPHQEFLALVILDLGIMGLGIYWGQWQEPWLGTVCGWEGVCSML